jgi:hypothetical protein
MSLEELAEL